KASNGDNNTATADTCVSAANCELNSATAKATRGDNNNADANACGSANPCLLDSAKAKAANGGNATSSACVAQTSCFFSVAKATAKGGTSNVNVHNSELGKAKAGAGGSAIVTPTGVSCSGKAHAKL